MAVRPWGRPDADLARAGDGDGTLARRLARGLERVAGMAVVEWRVVDGENQAADWAKVVCWSGLETPAQPFDSFGSDAGLDPKRGRCLPGAQGEVAGAQVLGMGLEVPAFTKKDALKAQAFGEPARGHAEQLAVSRSPKVPSACT